jgi:poly(A) polymerase
MKMFSKNLNFFSKIKKTIFPFYKNKELKEVFKILESNQENTNDKARYVGGCVRKFLKKEDIDDIDIATVFTPEEIKAKFNRTDIRVIETGIEHGSVTLLTKNFKLELTTLRKDLKTDGRHAEVKFTDDWKEDSNRRDFTINSIYLDKNGKIFDPQFGIKDLNNKIVRFIGNPLNRIEEDYLRIIRFIRFAIQYESEVDKQTVEAIKLKLNGIKFISKERILAELLKIIRLNNFAKILKNEDIKNIFMLVFPEFRYLSRLEKYKFNDKIFQIDEHLILGILLLDETNNYEYFCHKFKVSNAIKNNLDFLSKGLSGIKNNKEFLGKNIKENFYYLGKNELKKIIILNFFIKEKNSLEECLKKLQTIDNMPTPHFAINGKYLKNRGLTEGKMIGKALKELESIWIQNNFKISGKDIEIIIEKFK